MSVDLVRIVESIHREKNIPKEVLFDGLQSALATAARKHYPDAQEIQVTIDPDTGRIATLKDGVSVEPPDFGRIAAQTAKQVIIQKIREAERDTLFDEFEVLRGEMVTGTIQRFEGGAVTVNLGKTDGLLPRSESIPGESHHPGERVRAIVLDVRKVGQRVKIILSRTHPDFVRRLFELEIPEIADQTIQIRALAREAGYRSKVAVSSLDQKVDAVGACVGVRGTRIKNIVDELGGERIDIVRWNEALQVLIPNALQPAEIEEVLLCNLLGRAIVLVRDDQLSLAIGRRGQNVRLASKLVGWDIEIMTSEELDELIDKAVGLFSALDGCDTDLANRLVEQGILSYDDLSIMEIDHLVSTVEGFDEPLAQSLVSQAEHLAELAEQDETPRRKGARSLASAASVESRHEPPAGDESTELPEEPSAGGDQEPVAIGLDSEDAVSASSSTESAESQELPESPAPEYGDSADETETSASYDSHDLDLADEAGHLEHRGHEVTHPPVDDEEDPDETDVPPFEIRIGHVVPPPAEADAETDSSTTESDDRPASPHSAPEPPTANSADGSGSDSPEPSAMDREEP
ncbi:transcription termination factor NusA [Tautonia rosea]|uniref:transcription termination factor NusA n=1 Tax=Tautonia rosea TaxID=2728037 RepID=UPI0014728385|nr:transcription termination factor NusA [Tautonia rosea]